MNSIQITFNPSTLADFISAVECLAKHGATIAPSVSLERPPSVFPPDKGEAHRAYCDAHRLQTFKRSADERDRGLTLEQAAAERMTKPDWKKPEVHASYSPEKALPKRADLPESTLTDDDALG